MCSSDLWEVDSGKVVHRWNTPGFTSWGVIKSHHFLGGIFDLVFNPGGTDLYVCGMGPMHDPMAGNGTQLWQRFDWRTGAMLDETHGGESGQGLMEAIAFHPSKRWFVMAGRLFQGQWNLAVFDAATGRNLHAIDAKGRITDLAMLRDGKRLVLGKAKGQEKKKDGQWPAFGMIEIYGINAG